MCTVVIIQARVGSTRLPSKVLMSLMGKTVLEHVYQRVLCSKMINDVIIATTTEKEDDAIVDLCVKKSMKFYRGSMENVLERYYFAAKQANAETVVRITSDCPLIEPEVIDAIVTLFHEEKCDIATNA